MTITKVVTRTRMPSMNLKVRGSATLNVQTENWLSSATLATLVQYTLRRSQSIMKVMIAMTRSVCVARESSIARNWPQWTVMVTLYGTSNGAALYV